MSVILKQYREGLVDFNLTNNRFAFPTLGAETCLVEAFTTSATWATAVLTIYRSMDGVTPYALESAQTLTAASMSTTIDCSGVPYIIVQLTTNAGSTLLGVIKVTMSKGNP